VEQKAFFNADAAGNTAYGNAAGMAAFAVGPDYQTLEHLNALFGAFFNFLVHLNGVAAFDVDYFVTSLQFFQ
jgi:hypothetical protein